MHPDSHVPHTTNHLSSLRKSKHTTLLSTPLQYLQARDSTRSLRPILHEPIPKRTSTSGRSTACGTRRSVNRNVILGRTYRWWDGERYVHLRFCRCRCGCRGRRRGRGGRDARGGDPAVQCWWRWWWRRFALVWWCVVFHGIAFVRVCIGCRGHYDVFGSFARSAWTGLFFQ